MRGDKYMKNFKTSAKAAAAILMSLAMLTAAGCGESESDTSSQSSSADEEAVTYVLEGTQQSSDTTDDTEESGSFTLSIAGDMLIHDGVYNDALSNGGGVTYDFSPMLEYLAKITQNCDLNYYNQETILGGTELGLYSYPSFNSPQEAGDAMIDIGYNLVSTATNHSYDMGEEGVLASYEYWSSKEGVLMAGTYDSEESRNEIQIYECNGITYTMLNYTYGLNGYVIPDGKEYLVNVWPIDFEINDPENDTEYQAYKEQVAADIAAVRDQVDFLIVCMHAGIEYDETECSYQDDMAQFYADNGVDLVVGTHPHVVQPAEYIGDTLVYYSLGNLLSAQDSDDYYSKLVGLVATMTVRKTVDENGESDIVIEDVNNELTFCYYSSAYSDFKVVPFSDEDIGLYLTDYESVYEYYKDVFLQYDSSLQVAPCA